MLPGGSSPPWVLWENHSYNEAQGRGFNIVLEYIYTWVRYLTTTTTDLTIYWTFLSPFRMLVSTQMPWSATPPLLIYIIQLVRQSHWASPSNISPLRKATTVFPCTPPTKVWEQSQSCPAHQTNTQVRRKTSVWSHWLTLLISQWDHRFMLVLLTPQFTYYLSLTVNTKCQLFYI